MSPLHTATWPTQRHVTDELTSKSSNDMSLIPRPSAVLLSSWVIWEPIFMTFLSPLHECACFRSCETFSPLQAMVESSAMKQQDKKTTNFCNKFKEKLKIISIVDIFFCFCLWGSVTEWFGPVTCNPMILRWCPVLSISWICFAMFHPWSNISVILVKPWLNSFRISRNVWNYLPTNSGRDLVLEFSIWAFSVSFKRHA